MNLQFLPIKFVENLVYMGVGMLGVFIIIGVITAATYAIGTLTSSKKGSSSTVGVTKD